jgi:hypothetical protein
MPSEETLLRVCRTLYNQTKTVDGGQVCLLDLPFELPDSVSLFRPA